MKRLTLALALLLFLLAPSFAYGQGQPKKAVVPEDCIDCTTCKIGTRRQACRECGGRGTTACPTCSLLEIAWDPIRTLRENYYRLQAHAEDDPYALVQTTRAAYNSVSGVSPGFIACNGGPGLSSLGSFLNPKYTCQICKGKWQTDCPDCKGGLRKCAHCLGKKKETRACEDCNGKGYLPDPRLVAPGSAAKCNWCQDKAYRPCPELDRLTHTRPSDQVKCSACKGKRKATCRTCAGTNQTPCAKCKGHGQVYHFPIGGVPGSYSKCEQCAGKGSADCSECSNKGKIPCRDCEAKGKVDNNCKLCLGRDTIPCTGCFRNSPTYWEIAATFLDEQGERQRAVAAYRNVISRLDNHKLERMAYRKTFGLDYVLGRATKKNEISLECDKRKKKAEARIRRLEANRE